MEVPMVGFWIGLAIAVLIVWLFVRLVMRALGR